MNKKALVVVSFGTTYKIAQTAIEQIEQRLATTFGEYDFYRAFTSKMVINKLAQTEGLYVDT
ncbi:MAG: sirohydrochlorin cobaltochelatase, partial [Cellulosilyticaceae bacterium]